MTMGQNIGDEGSSPSGGQAPQNRRMSVWQLPIIFGGPVASRAWGVAPLPRYFQREKFV